MQCTFSSIQAGDFDNMATSDAKHYMKCSCGKHVWSNRAHALMHANAEGGFYISPDKDKGKNKNNNSRRYHIYAKKNKNKNKNKISGYVYILLLFFFLFFLAMTAFVVNNNHIKKRDYNTTKTLKKTFKTFKTDNALKTLKKTFNAFKTSKTFNSLSVKSDSYKDSAIKYIKNEVLPKLSKYVVHFRQW